MVYDIFKCCECWITGILSVIFIIINILCLQLFSVESFDHNIFHSDYSVLNYCLLIFVRAVAIQITSEIAYVKFFIS